MKDEPSDVYYKARDAAIRHHAGGAKTFSGQFTWKQRHRIKTLIDRYDVHSILDYGCGRGKQYQNVDENNGETLEQYWGITTTKYDPCVHNFGVEPRGVFDMVICVQVLGSIPRRDIPWVVDRLYRFASKVVFVVERITIGGPRKQIYEHIQDEMPYDMSGKEWVDLLGRDGESPKMHVLLKNSEFGPGWRETIL